jgi:hypothetical protein
LTVFEQTPNLLIARSAAVSHAQADERRAGINSDGRFRSTGYEP